MTEQTKTARERIADEVHAYGTAAANYHESGRGLDSVDAIAATDRILTIIRTALLSEPAVDAAAYQMDVTFGESYSLSAARDVISAAWDSVMGEGSEDSNEG